jgi:DNA modification methylase
MLVWNEPLYIDLFDKEKGLPFLIEQIESGNMEKVELMLTDPPYNVKFDGSLQSDPSKCTGANPHCYDDQTFYNDDIEDYVLWSTLWFTLAKQVADKIIFTCGNKNIGMWYSIEKPLDMFAHYKKNCMSQTSLARFNRWEPLLLYGNFRHKFDFLCNVFDVMVEAGGKKTRTIHPTPKPVELYHLIIKRLKPKTVIDPFFGSGAVGEACLILDVPFIGYEINPEYKPDWDKRKKFILENKDDESDFLDL